MTTAHGPWQWPAIVANDLGLGVEKRLHLEQRLRAAALVLRARLAQHQPLAPVQQHRLERVVLRLSEFDGEGSVRPLVLVYLNRLSDWLFVFGRWVCLSLGNEESLWLPLGHRGPESGVGTTIRKLSENDSDFDQF